MTASNKRVSRKVAFLFGSVLATLVLSSCSNEGHSATSGKEGGFPAALTFTPVATGFKDPTAIVSAKDGSKRLFVVEQRGVVKIVRNGSVARTPFLDISDLVTRKGSEQGLLDIEFAPDFKKSGVFFVDYTDKTGIGNTMIARFKVSSDPERADPASRTTILRIEQPYRNHNGGELAFGPDRFLYIGTGDGGSGGDPHGNAQRRDDLLGKLLRIDVLSGKDPYAIPKTNPFNSEVWAYGLRNPWRFSFDRETGDLYIADVGQDEVEEVDFQPAGAGAGANYGWNRMEGSSCFEQASCDKKGLTLPVAEVRHGHGDCSITGGYVYRGAIASLRGTYLYGDYCSGRIWGLRKYGTAWKTQLLHDTKFAISTFGEDEDGEVYVADYRTGTVYRIGAPAR